MLKFYLQGNYSLQIVTPQNDYIQRDFNVRVTGEYLLLVFVIVRLDAPDTLVSNEIFNLFLLFLNKFDIFSCY